MLYEMWIKGICILRTSKVSLSFGVTNHGTSTLEYTDMLGLGELVR